MEVSWFTNSQEVFDASVSWEVILAMF